ncbi:MAG: AAA family ATPase [Rubrivivax sp.]
MKLTRLRVAELRRFREPFEISDFAPGLNVFAAPNESGKSTLVRAIRAAFFERHRSSGAEDLRPWGDSAAAPTVELDFTLGGSDYRLVKSFLQKKRCELVAGARRWEGAEAEDHLAELLGFEFASRGGSDAKHWGIPGLLWVEQGTTQAIDAPVEHAAAHLQRALNASLGEVAATGGDEVLARVRDLRRELLTATGRPTGALAEALRLADESAARVAETEAAVQRHAEQVDRLKRLRDEHEAETQEAPWTALRQQLAQAEAALAAAEGLQREHDAAAAALRQADGLAGLLRQQIADEARRQQELAARESTRAGTQRRHEAATGAEAAARQALATAESRFAAARAALVLARQEQTRAQLGRDLAAARQAADSAAAALERARAEAQRATTLRREADALAVPQAELKTLRQQSQRLHELGIRQEAVATRLAFELQADAGVALDGAPLVGQGERRLTQAATLTLPGGTITVVPGGEDLAALVREHARLADERAALLQRLGLASADEAETRAAAHALKSQEAESARQTLALLAPQGLDTLEAERSRAQARHAEAEQALAALPPAPDTAPPAVTAAEAEATAAEQARADAARQAEARQRERATAEAEHQAAVREHQALAEALAAPERAEAQRRQQLALADAQAQQAAAQARLEAVQARIAAARPDILRQDVERLRDSATVAERTHQARDRQIVALAAELAAVGAQGLDEQLAGERAAAEHAARRRDELQRRADALDLLQTRLETHRQALTRRLQAPLQKHLDHYASLLFPAGRLEVGESLRPEVLARPGQRGEERGAFETLSFGAREQLGLVCRLAYADLLREAGRPTLVILDDALVHTDAERLERMKRIVFDAAQRHQLLVFSCHPAQWRDLGVPVRRLDMAG